MQCESIINYHHRESLTWRYRVLACTWTSPWTRATRWASSGFWVSANGPRPRRGCRTKTWRTRAGCVTRTPNNIVTMSRFRLDLSPGNGIARRAYRGRGLKEVSKLSGFTPVVGTYKTLHACRHFDILVNITLECIRLAFILSSARRARRPDDRRRLDDENEWISRVGVVGW